MFVPDRNTPLHHIWLPWRLNTHKKKKESQIIFRFKKRRKNQPNKILLVLYREISHHFLQKYGHSDCFSQERVFYWHVMEMKSRNQVRVNRQLFLQFKMIPRRKGSVGPILLIPSWPETLARGWFWSLSSQKGCSFLVLEKAQGPASSHLSPPIPGCSRSGAPKGTAALHKNLCRIYWGCALFLKFMMADWFLSVWVILTSFPCVVNLKHRVEIMAQTADQLGGIQWMGIYAGQVSVAFCQLQD